MQRFASKLLKLPKRNLHLHEYQASQLLQNYRLPVIQGGPAHTLEEVNSVAQNIKSQSNKGLVVKAQVHAGGRGRGSFKNSGLKSGVQIVKDVEAAKNVAAKMLNDVLVTKQSGAGGKPVNTLYIVEEVELKRELYLSILLDRQRAKPIIIASPQGGVGIEEIDKKFILQMPIDPKKGLTDEQVNEVVKFMELESDELKKTMDLTLRGLYNCFTEKDATMVEINPLGITAEGKMLICDCKVNIDDNSVIRQDELFKQEDFSQKDKKEVLAEKYELNYVKLDGNVGCLVNGAGLAMATMDLINFKGGKPANFLDVGGGASIERTKQAISIINEDADVKSILINIFGGIVRCDIIAEGAIRAARELNIKKPIIMRIKGTNADVAQKLIKESGLDLFWCETVDEAADKAISYAK